MEHSRPMLTNFDVQIAPLGYLSDVRIDASAHHQKDIVLLLSDFTRIGSLRLTETHNSIHFIIDSLCSSLPVHSLSLRLEDSESSRFILPDDLFVGKAPIRHLQFTAGCQFVAPHWLLRGITHFTSAESISPPELLKVLHQMPAFTYLEFHPLSFLWSNLDLDKLRTSPIHMPHLTNSIAHTGGCPDTVILLTQLLSPREGAKKRLELHLSEFCDWVGHQGSIEGEQREGWFRPRTGSEATAWEDAGFCLFAEWRRLGGANTRRSDSLSRFVALGLVQGRKLVIDLPSPNQWKFWYRKKRPVGIILVGATGEASHNRRVGAASHRCRIIRLPNSIESEAVSVEKEIENVSSKVASVVARFSRVMGNVGMVAIYLACLPLYNYCFRSTSRVASAQGTLPKQVKQTRAALGSEGPGMHLSKISKGMRACEALGSTEKECNEPIEI
ncbi:hypothetical protein EDB87DRAFT_1824701 [Lactarius vividus]|nr:hypothetical protein EDB87DRAFT_1824701 [Lactarius vividus]